MAPSQDPDSENSQVLYLLKGDKADNGAVTNPDKIVKMQTAADSALGKL